MTGDSLGQKPSSVFLEQLKTRRKIVPVVYVHLEGGASPWDTFMPFEESVPAEFRGQYKSIQTKVPGLRVSELLPQFAAHADKFSTIRSVDSESNDHFTSTEHLLVRDGQALGKVLGEQVPDTIIPYTFLNPEGRYQNDEPTLRDHHPELSLRIDWNSKQKRFTAPQINCDPRIKEKRKLLTALDNLKTSSASIARMEEMRERAFAVLTGEGSYFKAFNIPDAETERFGQVPGKPPNQFAHAAALSSRLVQNGAAFVTIHSCEQQGWDMHGGKQIENQLPVLARNLDVGLVALMQEAREKGFLVMCSSEFGRTPKVNRSGGRDHHAVHFATGAGGYLQPGTYGSYNRDGTVKEDKVTNAELHDFMSEAAGVTASESKLSKTLLAR